jgi:hypothetical protein
LSTERTGPNVGHGSNVGPFSKATLAAKRFATVLKNDSVGDIATAAGVSKETAKNWKLGKRMPSGEAMLDLQTNLRSVRDYTKRRWDGHESPEVQHAIAQAEYALQSLAPHQRETAMAVLKQRNLT